MTVLQIVTRASLAVGVPRIDIHTEVDNQAKDHRLRVHFPAPFLVDSADYDGHFEIVRRTIGVAAQGEGWVEAPRPEAPQRAFTNLSDGHTGLMIANRGLPEVEALKIGPGTEIALTLLRCVGWLSRDDLAARQGHAGPSMTAPGAQMQGKWSFDYAIIPHSGGWQAACQQAYAFETPLRAMSTRLAAGSLASSGAFISHSPAEFVISAIKEAEEGAGWIVRGVNLSSKMIDVQLTVNLPFGAAVRVNLAEEPLEELTLGEEGAAHFKARSCEVVTLSFTDRNAG